MSGKSFKASYLEEMAKVRRGESIGSEQVNHPSHYGGENNPYEAIKVIEAWELNFCLGNVVKYVARAGKKQSKLEDLKKALWYLEREVANAENEKP